MAICVQTGRRSAVALCVLCRRSRQTAWDVLRVSMATIGGLCLRLVWHNSYFLFLSCHYFFNLGNSSFLSRKRLFSVHEVTNIKREHQVGHMFLKRIYPKWTIIRKKFCRTKKIYYLCTRKNANAQMAESVDALVSNTSGATHPGSSPGLGTD